MRMGADPRRPDLDLNTVQRSGSFLERASQAGTELDALAARLGLRRNAIYKVIFDARRKIRRALVANGYLEETTLEQR